MTSDALRSGSMPDHALLGRDDPAPVSILRPGGASRFMLIGDHAGNAVPASLGTLGISEVDRRRHIGWDIGIAGLGQTLAEALDAPFVQQHYSRLVVDCNRRPEAPDAMPAVSDGTPIPANTDLSADDRAERVRAIHEPYQTAIDGLLRERDAAGLTTILLALHSFTPRMNGFDRPWQIGVLHHAGDPGFALRMLDVLRARGDLVVGDNEPYRMDLIDYTIPRHAYPALRPYAEIEIRQDLLATRGQQQEWADLLVEVLTAM